MTRKDPLLWVLGTLLALGCGWVHLHVDDPTVTALLVVMLAMGLAFAAPERVWRWAVLTSVAVPAAQVFNYLRGVPFQRGEAQGAFVIGVVSGIVGTVAGYFGHKVFSSLLRGLRERPGSVGDREQGAGQDRDQGTGDREQGARQDRDQGTGDREQENAAKR